MGKETQFARAEVAIGVAEKSPLPGGERGQVPLGPLPISLRSVLRDWA